MVTLGPVKWPEKSKRYHTKVETRQIEQGIKQMHRHKTRNPEVQCKLELVENTKKRQENIICWKEGKNKEKPKLMTYCDCQITTNDMKCLIH